MTIGDRKTDREAFGDHYDTWKGWTFDLVEGRAYTAKSHGKKEAKYGKSGKYITLKDRKGLHRMIMAAYLAARGGKYIKAGICLTVSAKSTIFWHRGRAHVTNLHCYYVAKLRPNKHQPFNNLENKIRKFVKKHQQ
ncbi:hypothetical protein [Limosilactobacillus sp.]|uniref:hypothetical protein n=1 Tax=Limosilactobacillus sp. TaxID=2773925 RepID=UPI003EFF4D8E